MQTLWGMPALEDYPHRVPARVYNLWRRYWIKHGKPLRFALAGIPPMALDLEERLWTCVDASLNDAPVIAWSDFRDRGRPLHAAVPCVVTHFHFGACAIRDRVLDALANELATRLG